MKQASKQADMQPLIIFTYQGRGQGEERDRHNTDTYITCTGSKPTENIHAYVHGSRHQRKEEVAGWAEDVYTARYTGVEDGYIAEEKDEERG